MCGETIDLTSPRLKTPLWNKKTYNAVLGIQPERYRNSVQRVDLLSSKNIKLSQACEGMIRYKQAAGKSDATVYDYRVTFKKLLLFSRKIPRLRISREAS